MDAQPFEAPAGAAYARLRAELEAAGSPIGGNHLMIAAHAVATACIAVMAAMARR